MSQTASPEDLAKLSGDPLRWVYWAFPWGRKGLNLPTSMALMGGRSRCCPESATGSSPLPKQSCTPLPPDTGG